MRYIKGALNRIENRQAPEFEGGVDGYEEGPDLKLFTQFNRYFNRQSMKPIKLEIS